jgi:hypothetical protein
MPSVAKMPPVRVPQQHQEGHELPTAQLTQFDLEPQSGCRKLQALGGSTLLSDNTGGNDMMRIGTLTPTFLTLLCLAVALPAKDLLAQQRLFFKVAAENTKYTQQHTIDVGDVSGHQVRLFEIHRTYPSNAPVINGMKMVESWTRGISDYTNNNGEGISFGVYVLENGDKIFTRGSLVAVQSPEASNLTATTVGPITGGTGKLARINGMARTITAANPKTGVNETQVDIEYWLPQ